MGAQQKGYGVSSFDLVGQREIKGLWENKRLDLDGFGPVVKAPREEQASGGSIPVPHLGSCEGRTKWCFFKKKVVDFGGGRLTVASEEDDSHRGR